MITANDNRTVRVIDPYSGSLIKASSKNKETVIEKVMPATLMVSVFTETNS